MKNKKSRVLRSSRLLDCEAKRGGCTGGIDVGQHTMMMMASGRVLDSSESLVHTMSLFPAISSRSTYNLQNQFKEIYDI